VRSALDYINGAKAADVWLFPDVRSDELLYEVLRRHPRARRQRAQIAPMVKAADADSFALYRKRLGAHRCRELARLRRRLEEAGALQFSRLTGGAAFSQGIDWLLSQKVAWLERANRKNNWLGSKPFATLLKATQAGEERGPSLFTLRLNGRLIACEYSHVDACRVEAFIGAYDPALGRFAPGQILQDECIGWSLCRGLDYDFRLGDEDYKTPSADAAVEATSFALLTSWLARFYDPAISTLRALKGWWGRFAEPH
jgi:CelD/BcsL family acetyltransferase involved in cellulose biosynthesis